MSNELVVVKPGTYAVAAAADSVDLVKAAFEQGATAFSFDRSRVPAGGGTTWQVPSLQGEQAQQAIVGVIAHVQGRQKAWWAVPMDKGGGGNAPPACTSTDGMVGVGNNREDGLPDGDGRHDCASCGWNQFKSARNGGGGKDCKDFARLYVFREGSFLPMVVTVPPTSLRGLQQHVMRLLDQRLPVHAVVSRLRLEKDKSASGITYSRIAFDFVGALPQDEAARMREVALAVKAGVSGAPIEVSASEVGAA